MKKGSVLLFALLFVVLVLVGVGIYYYLNVSGKIAPKAAMITPATESTSSSKFREPTPTLPIEEEINNLQIATDDAELRDLNKDLQGL
jgi:flagellar basal body-associated protein FliL